MSNKVCKNSHNFIIQVSFLYLGVPPIFYSKFVYNKLKRTSAVNRWKWDHFQSIFFLIYYDFIFCRTHKECSSTTNEFDKKLLIFYLITLEVNFTNTLRAAFFLQKFCMQLFCTNILGLCFLAPENWRKRCSHNVGEVDTWGQFHQHFTCGFFVRKFCTKLFCTQI